MPTDLEVEAATQAILDDLGYAEAYDDYKYLAHAALEAAEKVRLEEVHRRGAKKVYKPNKE